MAIITKTRVYSHQIPVRIQTIVNTPSADNAVEKPNSGFSRVQDYSQSYSELINLLVEEEKIAEESLPKAKTTDELHDMVTAKLRPHTTGKDHFSTWYASPALRHFLNDSCRLLEPHTPLFVGKFSGVKFSNQKSLGLCISDLLKQKHQVNDLDLSALSEIYEVWNDYKHRDTNGLSAGSWTLREGIVHRPKLNLPTSLKITYIELKDLDIFEFIEKVNRTILGFLHFVYDLGKAEMDDELQYRKS